MEVSLEDSSPFIFFFNFFLLVGVEFVLPVILFD